LNQQIELVAGKIQKIYTMEGVRVTTIDQLKNDNVLVANDDPFISVRYNQMALDPQAEKPGLNGFTLYNDFIAKIRPITTRKSKRPTTNGTIKNRSPTREQQRSSTREKNRPVTNGRESTPIPKKPSPITVSKKKRVQSRGETIMTDKSLSQDNPEDDLDEKKVAKPRTAQKTFVALKGGDEVKGFFLLIRS
jgi:hypothetical protein